MKDHLFIQSLEKEGQEWLRGESAIPAAQWGGQLETGRSLTHTRAPLAPSERKRGERNEREGRGGRRDRGRGSPEGRERESPRQGIGSCWLGITSSKTQKKSRRATKLTVGMKKKRKGGREDKTSLLSTFQSILPFYATLFFNATTNANRNSTAFIWRLKKAESTWCSPSC